MVSDGLPTFYMKLNPDKKSSYCRIEGDLLDLAALLAKHMEQPEVSRPIMLAMMAGKNVQVFKM